MEEAPFRGTWANDPHETEEYEDPARQLDNQPTGEQGQASGEETTQ